jgi:hypothetical protein
MPFIEGTSTDDLAMILEDEFDILAEFRSSIRELIIEAKSKNPDVSAILHDVVNPRVAKLQRRFEHITNMSKLKVGGAALATASLALTSILSGGIVAGIGAIAGASGALMVAKEYVSGANELQALKDDPTYLLWKLDGVRRLTS